MATSLHLDTPISKTSWSLYWHPTEGRDWSLPSFTHFGTMKTWREFLSLMEALTVSTLSDGMFFLMRDPIPPLWENSQNIYGGAYSFRVPKASAGASFVHYGIAAILETVTTSSANTINGLSISPKKHYNIVKIWNTDAGKFKRPDDLLCLLSEVKTPEVQYKAFTDMKM